MFPARSLFASAPKSEERQLRRRGTFSFLVITILAAALFAGATPSNGQSLTATWTQNAYPAGASNGPGGRGWVDLTYDLVNRRVVLVGGSASGSMNDVWWYDAVSDRWSIVAPPSTCSHISDFVPPTGREEHAVEYDPVNQLYWMFGGTGSDCVGPNRTAWTGTTTTAIVDPTLTATTPNVYKDWTVQVNNSYAYVAGYDPASKKLTLSKSIAGAISGAHYLLYPQRGSGTWYYSPVSRTWASLTGPHWGYTGPAPLSRLSPSMAFSSRDNAMVMFGGQGTNDTWALDVVAKKWRQLLPGGAAGSPPARAQITNSMVYDSVNDVFVLFGGCLCTGNSGPSAGDTWAYRLSTNTWTKMSPAVSPPPRQAHNMVYDTANQVVVLFGGYDMTTGKLFNDLWIYSYATNTWTQLFPSASPPPRGIAGMAYDPVNRLTVLYAGGTTSGSLYDVWVLNLRGLSAVNPTPSLTSLLPGTVTVGSAGFTLNVTGSNFVSGSVVRWNGASRPTTYVRSTSLQAAIPAGDIAGAGSALVTVFSPGPGGGTSNPMSVAITAINPVPTLTSMSPTSAMAGGSGFYLTVTGTGFGPSSVVRWNGISRTTSLVNGTQLKAAIHSTDILGGGTTQVRVVTSGPGGGTSGTLPFTVGASSSVPSNPMPTLTSLSPNTASAGGPGFFLTVTGTGFGPTSTVNWNGSSRTTSLVSGTQLKATMHSTDILSGGTAQVSVVTSGPGGGTSGTLPFTVGASSGVPSVPAPTPPPVPAPTAPVAGLWTTLPNTRAFDAMAVADFYSGYAAYNPQGLFAYSGGDLLQVSGVWGFVLTGGGHAATPDNSTLFIPFDGSGPRQLQGPYTSPDRVYKYDVPLTEYLPSGVWTDARKSVHTYSSFVKIEKGGQPFLFLTNGSTYTGSGAGSNVTRLFDLAQTRAQAMARPDLGWQKTALAPFSSVASASGWDPVQKRVVHRGAKFIGAYYPETDVWENWNIFPAATLCCDFSASVAMDITGRKMYVLGDGLAEMYDLDTKAYTNLATQPWAARFIIRGTEGPGLAWHERTKQIVAWMAGIDGNAVDVINPATGTRTSVPMGGVTVSTPPAAGTYGRFRMLPGTDQVVLVNSVTENVFIGTIPFDGAALPPSPPPVGGSPSPPAPAPVPVTLNAPGSITWTAPANPDGTSFNLAASFTTVPTSFPAGTVPAQYRVTLRQTFSNTVLIPYGGTTSTAGRADTGGLLWTAIGPGSYDVTVALEDASGAVLSAAGPTTFLLGTGSGTPPPAPSPSPGTVAVPPGMPLPIRTWVERPLPPVGQAYMAGNGGKHGRAFYHAGLKSLVFAGGDWSTSQPQYDGPYRDGVGSEVWSLDALTDKWTRQRPMCVPGETQPGHPDSVGWAYDSKRNRGLMAPGFYFITQQPPGGFPSCGALEGFGGYAFDFATRKFIGPDAVAGMPPPPNGWGGDGGASFATYDPVNDEFIRVRQPRTLERLNLASGVWRVQGLPGTPTWNPNSNRSQLVIDVKGRAVYFLDRDGDRGGFAEGKMWPATLPALVRVSLVDGSVTSFPLPSQYTPPADGAQDVYLAFDPVNRLVLVPNNIGMGQSPILGLGLFNVDLVSWTWEPVPSDVWGSVWGFDENIGAMIGIGKRAEGTSYFIYKAK